MKVRAATGLQCPMEAQPRVFITDDAKGVEVPDSSYYRRLIADGSLEEVAPVQKNKGGDQ